MRCSTPICDCLVALEHPRVISAATFSPLSGSSIMSTCGDNRIRIWDSIGSSEAPPSRELVHSHDFNRCALIVAFPIVAWCRAVLM